jgi:hypothetical protein
MKVLHFLIRGELVAAYDRMVGQELGDLAVDGCITKAPCGGDPCRRGPVERGNQGANASVTTERRRGRSMGSGPVGPLNVPECVDRCQARA